MEFANHAGFAQRADKSPSVRVQGSIVDVEADHITVLGRNSHGFGWPGCESASEIKEAKISSVCSTAHVRRRTIDHEPVVRFGANLETWASLQLFSYGSPSEEAIRVIPIGRLGEVQAVEPAADGRVLDRLEAHIGEPQFAGAGEPDLELGSLGCGVLGLEDDGVRLPFGFGREILVLEQRLPVGCILHGPSDLLARQALGPGSQRQPIPLAAPDGQFVLGDHDLRRAWPRPRRAAP